MYNYANDLNWRMATASDLSKAYFFVIGLPTPVAFDYEGHTERTPQSTGGEKRQGYKTLSVVWSMLTARQSYRLKQLLEVVIAASTPLYMTIPRQDGDACLDQDWIDISGTPIMPKFASPPNSRGVIHSPVELRINNITIENDPATF